MAATRQAPRDMPPLENDADLGRRVRAHARALGFDVVGVARADAPLDVDHARYLAFLERGFHGDMAWLAAHAEARRRVDGPAILEGARSVVCVGKRYARPAEDEARDRGIVPHVARYAQGSDYHGHLKKRLRRLAELLRSLAPGVEARALCDIEPVLERAWAARAGVGFVGKNGLVIAPGAGSYLLLGEVVTTLALDPDEPLTERCGACTRCLDACPTNAFAEPFVLDPRRCISYLTIEAEGAPDEPLRAGVGEHLFGCDACQEACPFNRTAAPPLERTAAFHPHERWQALDVDAFVAMDDAAWDAVSVGSPLRRAGRAGLARNAALVAANRLARDPGGPGARASRRALELATVHDDAAVREVAAWGLAAADARAEGFEPPRDASPPRDDGPPAR
jgi:epoxyqueuosine reductase